MSDEEKLVKYDAIMNARKKASNKFYDKHIRNGGDDPERQRIRGILKELIK